MQRILKYYKALFILSGVVLVLGVLSLTIYGLNFGIDFKGGTVTELVFKTSPNSAKIRDILTEEQIKSANIQTAGQNGVIIKTESIEKDKHDAILEKIKSQVGEFEEKRYESIGPSIGKELTRSAIWQLILVSLGIVLYLAYAFRQVPRPLTSWQFGFTAVIALFHDLLVVLGVFSILSHFKGFEVDSLFVTAMLTVLGFSVHDTIVVFDRIRENLRRDAGQSLDHIVNHSISQTIVRSLNTSLSVLFVLLAMLLFGGESIRYFVLTLFIGIVAGTYSSIFVASPLLVLWQKWRTKHKFKKA